MATTAMDYENANGDRFDGEFLPLPHHQCRVRSFTLPPAADRYP
jgi:hypothetical protein